MPGKHKCNVLGCSSNSSLVKCFHFPKDKARYAIWENFCQNPNSCLHKYICAKHFDLKHFVGGKRSETLLKSSKPNPTLERPISTSRSEHDRIVSSEAIDDLDMEGVVSSDVAPSSHLPSTSFSTTIPQPSSSFSPFPHPFTSSSPLHTSCRKSLFTSYPCEDSVLAMSLSAENIDSSVLTTASSSSGINVLTDTSVKVPKLPQINSFSLKDVGATRYEDLTPRKEKMARHIRKMKKEVSRLRRKFNDRNMTVKQILETNVSDITDNLATKMSVPAALILRSQLRLGKIAAKGRRWTLDEKLLALTFYKRSPSNYAFLRSIFCLPGRSTLVSLLNAVPLKTGINEPIFSSLSSMVSEMDKADKLCVLMFDEMNIRENLWYDCKEDIIVGYEDLGAWGRTSSHAKHALVFMAKGLKQNWQQPLAFYFTRGGLGTLALVELIKEVIAKCQEIGLTVVCTVSDMGTANVSAIKALGATKDTPIFKIKDSNVIALFDPPHLLKSVRNNLINYNATIPLLSICIDELNISQLDEHKLDLRASWSDILEAVNFDAGQGIFRVFHKITKEHLHPEKSSSKMKVSYAAQVLSHTMAGCILMLIRSGVINKKAVGTVQFLWLFNRLFDCCNGYSHKPDGAGGYRSCLVKKREDFHLNFIDIGIDVISHDLKFVTPTGKVVRPPCLDGWVQTLKGLKLVWECVKEHGFDFLITKRLNQDTLERLFGAVRANCGSNCNPTIIQFTSALKTIILNNLSRRSLRNCNVEAEPLDEGGFLCDVKSFFQTGETDHPSEVIVESVLSSESPEFDDDLDDPDQVTSDVASISSGTTYVAGYIVRRLLLKILCSRCEGLLVAPNADASTYDCIQMKEYSSKTRSLSYPSQDFRRTVEGASEELEKILPDIAHLHGVRTRAINFLKSTIDFEWIVKGCPVHSTKLIDEICYSVSRLCISWWIKRQNRSISESASHARNRRKMNILSGQ